MPHGEEQRADAKLVGRADGGGDQLERRHVEQREVGLTIARDHAAVGPGAVGATDADAGARHDVRVRHHPPGRPDHPRADRCPGVGQLHRDLAQRDRQGGEVHQRGRGGRSPTVNDTSRAWPARTTLAAIG
jgi:hypothetical protein